MVIGVRVAQFRDNRTRNFKILNYSPDYSLNCTPLSPITITYYNNGILQQHIHQLADSLSAVVPVELELSSVGFCGGRKTGEPGENNKKLGSLFPTDAAPLSLETIPTTQRKALVARREPTTNSIHMRRRVRESNPGHRGGTGASDYPLRVDTLRVN